MFCSFIRSLLRLKSTNVYYDGKFFDTITSLLLVKRCWALSIRWLFLFNPTTFLRAANRDWERHTFTHLHTHERWRMRIHKMQVAVTQALNRMIHTGHFSISLATASLAHFALCVFVYVSHINTVQQVLYYIFVWHIQNCLIFNILNWNGALYSIVNTMFSQFTRYFDTFTHMLHSHGMYTQRTPCTFSFPISLSLSLAFVVFRPKCCPTDFLLNFHAHLRTVFYCIYTMYRHTNLEPIFFPPPYCFTSTMLSYLILWANIFKPFKYWNSHQINAHESERTYCPCFVLQCVHIARESVQQFK